MEWIQRAQTQGQAARMADIVQFSSACHVVQKHHQCLVALSFGMAPNSESFYFAFNSKMRKKLKMALHYHLFCWFHFHLYRGVVSFLASTNSLKHLIAYPMSLFSDKLSILVWFTPYEWGCQIEN